MNRSILAPAGAPASKLNASELAGRSASVAVAVNDNSVNSSTVWSPIALSTGATLTSFTVTVIVSESSSAPLTLTKISPEKSLPELNNQVPAA